MMTARQRKIPAPTPTVETQAFWDAASQGRFLIPRCTSCGKAHWYPRALCPFCFSDKTVWEEASGKGRIYTYSVMRRAPEPYAIAYVTLEEGPTMMTNLVQCDFDALRIGQAVKLVFSPTEGGPPVPTFTPV
jgi:uncharacterized OB-fold protein